MPRSLTDSRLATVLSVLAILLAAGALVVPLPLGLAGVLIAGWALWRSPAGARLPWAALALAVAGTCVGIAVGLVVTRAP